MAAPKNRSKIGLWNKYKISMGKVALNYIHGGYESRGDIVPSIVGLASLLDVSPDTLENWNKDKSKGLFFGMLGKVKLEQERLLLNGGLSSQMNAAICKLMLCKHGYSEKTENKIEYNPAPTDADTIIDKLMAKHEALGRETG